MPATAFEREVLHTLGELATGQRRLEEDTADARESRRRIYQKLEESGDAIIHLQNDVKIAASIAAQARDKVDIEVMPAVRTINGLKLQGAAIITAAAVIGGGLTALASTQGGAFWKWLQGIFT